MSDAIHPFERAGFGKAPYRCVGYRKNIFQSCPGAPIQAGGSCDFCGTGIMHEYTIKSAHGSEFVVGCDCVRRVHASLVKELAAVRRDSARAERRAAWEARERAENGGRTRAEIWAEERAIRAAEALARAEAREAKRLASQWVGTVGKREIFGLTLTGRYAFESHYSYQPTITVLYFLEDASGNAFVWKTSTGFGRAVERGEKVKVKATVKSHDTYKDARQTMLARCVEVQS